jgi:SAM-dependent methyltransferase
MEFMAKQSFHPNRILDLDDLNLPAFRGVLRSMDRLLTELPGFYLHPSKRWEYPWALSRAGVTEGCRVLDVGCGASIFPPYLASLGYRVTACDFDSAPACNLSTGAEFLRADISALPFAADSFDAAFCISVIEHLDEGGITRALAELHRVVRPDGRVLLTTDYYERADAEIWYEGPDGLFPVDWNIFDEARLRRHVLQAPGFRIDGEVNLEVDWPKMSPRMRRFHGYPYTSVGIALVKI